MTTRKKLVAGNWKMNGNKASLKEVEAMVRGLPTLPPGVELAICPPATLAGMVAHLLAGTPMALGGQDAHHEASGAFTGNVSAEMWADLGASYIIVGHSERRDYHLETDAVVSAKASAAIKAGLTPIVCIGESLAERDAGSTLDVVLRQLAASVPEGSAGRLVVAYEPIWAIGTGRTPTAEQVAEVHTAMRNGLRQRFGAVADDVKLLYGGSVKPENAKTLMHVVDVDGALVGGASLKAADFLAIAVACG